ncbi:MAG TPA: hypothetical protein VJ608_14055 [Albitalea sp.]|nr:hypothetical protein [Albitalea sp.]
MDVGNLDSEAMPYVFSVSGRVEPRHEEPMALPELNRSMEPATYDQLRLMLSSSVVGGINEAVAVLAAEISPTTRCAGGTSR